MSFIDAKIAQGFDQKIAEALVKYTGVPMEQLRVVNDALAPEDTLIHLDGVDVTKPKLKLRLRELETHQGAHIKIEGEPSASNVTIRIKDSVIEALVEEDKF